MTAAEPEPAPPSDETGRVVGGWRILSRLGGGAEGTVYLAESTDGLGKRVALKRFAGAARERHRRELEAYRRVEEIRRASGTPHLVEGIAAAALEDGTGMIALAYHEGGSLADRVRASGPLPATEAARLAREVLSALALLHEAGLCHRDVKPHNVLVGQDGRARLGDFGLATPSDREISTGGTPAFAAPEQWDDPAAGASSTRSGIAIDVYGAGATLYFLLAGRPPLPGRPDLFALEAARAPRPLQDAVLRALEVDPALRFPSAAAFSEALAPAPPPTSAPAPRASAPRARGRALALLGLALPLAAILLVRGGPSAPLPAAMPALPAPPDDPRDPAVASVALPDGRLARGTLSGRVLLLDPRAPTATPIVLHEFRRTVVALRLEGDALVATGDDRAPAPLAAGAAPPPGSIAVEGASGRFSFPREPQVREVRLPVPRR